MRLGLSSISAVFTVLLLALAGCGSNGASPATGVVVPSGPELTKRAQAGDKLAQFELGYQICCGSGDENGRQDMGKATQWLCRAARQGEPRAQYRLGLIYADGLTETGLASRLLRRVSGGGVEAKPRLAAMWFDLAMAGGHEEAPGKRLALGKHLRADDHIAVEKMRTFWRDEPCEWRAVQGTAQAR